MGVNFNLAELRSRLNHLDPGAILRISEYDYERLFGINEVAAANVAQFARMHRCVSVPGAEALYFRKWDADAYSSTELVQHDGTISR
jgi:hypothetical protein